METAAWQRTQEDSTSCWCVVWLLSCRWHHQGSHLHGGWHAGSPCNTGANKGRFIDLVISIYKIDSLYYNLKLYFNEQNKFRDLQEDLIKLQNSGLSQIDATKRILGNQIEELKKLHNNPRPEVRTDFHNIKAEMLESFRAMQKENSVILSELTEMKELVKKIFYLVVQISYKV